ncbi:F0F1 ATP synthase subunit epsilon [Alkalibacter mobilis]|uniref:F0F1 ATP synthase subunit epsilon n=1 Tax=Alkalibacter mobilis TaxID=2787712 RepID=UPI0018A0A020|nr:F0F1 ATP synthase subunit epsilon [Alkalibacter mobilis]MBF7097482.1 F0F1 ATP synthase subunit epsilon [Alkalibacter mobilis]
MNVKLIIPNKTIVDREADKITAPGSEGYFQMYPRHIDFVSGLKAGILTIESDAYEEYYAINYGILVKQADVVYIVCHQVIEGDSLETLNEAVTEKFSIINEKEKATNEILAKMEIETLKRFFEME